MLNKYQSIIWDWNGTLLNDVWLCVDIVNEMLQKHNNNQLDKNSYKNAFGFPITEYYEKIGIDLEQESFEVLTTKFISNYEANVRKCTLHEYVFDILNILHKNEMQQFILTAAHKESVLPLLKHFSIRDYFKEIEGLDNHRAESKVKNGLRLVKNNRLSKEKTVLIGDTIHDFEVANEMGVHCILIANGHQSKERLIDKTRNKIKILDNIQALIA